MSSGVRRSGFRPFLVLLLVPLLPASSGLRADEVVVPGGEAAVRRLVGLDDGRPAKDFFLDLSRAFLQGTSARASWSDNEKRRAVADFAEDLASFRKEYGCPSLLSASPDGWKRTRRALEWLGYRVRGDGPGFSAEPRQEPEALRRQGFLGLLGLPAPEVLGALAAGEKVTVPCEDGRAELPYGLPAWRETLGLDEKRLYAGSAFLRFVKDVPATRMLVALHSVDAGTREEMRALAGPAGGWGGWKLLFDEALDGFALYPEALEMSQGRLLLPGGETALPAWEEVVGAPASDRPAFVVRFFGAAQGKAAYVAETLRLLPDETARAFVLGRAGRGEAGTPRFRRLYDAVGKVGRSFGVSQRDAFDLAHVAPFLSVSPDGEIAVPGGARVWREALEGKGFPPDEAALEALLAASRERDEDAGALLELLLRRQVDGLSGPVPATRPFAIVSALVRARPALADPGTVLLLARGAERFLPCFAPLEDLPLEDPALARRYLFTLHRLDTAGTGRDAELRAGLFQAAVELLSGLHRSGALGETQARELFSSLLALPLIAAAGATPAAEIGPFHAWLEGGLLAALREEEARHLAARYGAGEEWDEEEERVRPARTADDLLAAALTGWRAPSAVSFRGGTYEYDTTAARAARRRAFARTQEHVAVAGLLEAAAGRANALDAARRGDVAAARTAVEALLVAVGALPIAREADERVRAVAAGGRLVLGTLQGATRENVLSLLEAGLGRIDALRAERTLEALAVHVYSSCVLDPDDLPFADPLLVRRHVLAWSVLPGGASATPFAATRLEPAGEGAVQRFSGAFAGLADPLGLLHAEGLVHSSGAYLANDRVRAGLAVPVVLLSPGRLDDDALLFADRACRAVEQLPAALAGRPEGVRREAWSALARDLVPAWRRNRLSEDGPVNAADWLSPSDLFRVGRRLVERPPDGLPEVPAVAEARAARARLVARSGEAGAAARLAELGPRPFHWAGLSRLSDLDLPPYERLSSYRFPHLFSDRLHDLKVVVARSVVAAGDPAAALPIYLEPVLDGLLRRARMAWAFDWRPLTGADRPVGAAEREELLGEALEAGTLTRREARGPW